MNIFYDYEGNEGWNERLFEYVFYDYEGNEGWTNFFLRPRKERRGTNVFLNTFFSEYERNEEGRTFFTTTKGAKRVRMAF